METQLTEAIKQHAAAWSDLKAEVKKVIVGQDHVIEKLCISILCNGHILLEGVPGLAKTTLIKAFSQAISLDYQRIQFTPDLLPADVIGTLMYNPKSLDFEVKKGPIFANIILADEINRAPAKVQSALLEAMQEHQVTIGDTTYKLDEPFLVLATQNPIDQEGTYRLPEAQVDRFMFKVVVTYPQAQEEKEIINKFLQPERVSTILDKEAIKKAQSLVSQIYIDEKVIDYIVAIVQATRNPIAYKLNEIATSLQYGASPRASLALTQAAKAHAFLRKREFVIPDDVKAVVFDIVRHRMTLSYEAEADGITPDLIINKILRAIPAP